MVQRIAIELEGAQSESARDVLNSLQTDPAATEAGIKFELVESRAIETAIIVAVIGGGAAVLSALIQAAANIASAKGGRAIKVKGKHGGNLEIPLDASAEEVDAAVAQMRKLESPSLVIL